MKEKNIKKQDCGAFWAIHTLKPKSEINLNCVLIEEELKFYKEFSKLLDNVEGFHEIETSELHECDLSDFPKIEAGLEKFCFLLEKIRKEEQNYDVISEDVTVVTQLEDRWKCYEFNSRDLFREHRLKSLGAYKSVQWALKEAPWILE